MNKEQRGDAVLEKDRGLDWVGLMMIVNQKDEFNDFIVLYFHFMDASPRMKL